jgi:hypothetical protein
MEVHISKGDQMLNTKLMAGILLVLAVLFAQVGNVAAAPLTQDTTPITGTIQDITTETDANGVTTVLVTLLDDQGTTQTVRLSVQSAVTLGLVTLDPTTQEAVVDEDQVGQTIEIDPVTVIPEEEQSEESVHPIAWLLAEFFGEDPSVVDGYHEDGFGFGVIAQALWISRNLTGTEDQTGDASLAEDILQAKQDKDFEAFFESHPEYLVDGSVPTNWGQFKKALSEKKNNLGVIVSGQEDTDSATDSLSQEDHGNGKDKDNGNGKDKEKGKDKNKNKNKP